MPNLNNRFPTAANDIAKDTFAVHLQIGQFTTDWHTHSKHQFLYAEHGVVHLQTRQHHFFLPARHAAWIPAQTEHKVYSNSTLLHWRNLYFHVEDDIDPVLKQFRVFTVSNLAREMILYTEKWHFEDEADELERQFFQTLRLLTSVWIKDSLPLILPVTEHPQMSRVIEYIEQNLAGDLSLDVVSAQFSYSKRTLMRLFKAELGMTFGTYIRVARIIWALELLTQPGVSVTEVALTVGYQSLSAFSQTFRQLVGVSPQGYLELR
ncbi:MAG: helix-turn-helix transcriptional regulator [Chloroflexota bacterium]